MLKSWETKQKKKELEDNSKKLPLWFAFPGSSAYCEGAGRDLMRIPVFAAAIKRAATVLQPFNFDLVLILTEASETVSDDVINAMVSIIAVQIALVDVLRSVGLDPDGIFGTSLGEIGAAYADETLTIEQAVLTAYWRGRCMTETNVPVGPKAILYISKEQFAKRCPSDIDIIAFFVDRVAVAGPDTSIKDIVDVLSSEGIEAKIFGTTLLQFHSRYVEDAASAITKHLEPIICNPKPHSPRWISTSLPAEKWESETGNVISAEFIGNNIRAPVDLITPIRAMPKNAVLMEISANAQLLQYIKPNIPTSVTTIELICKEALDPVRHLLEAIKKIYEATGRQPPVEQLSAVFGTYLFEMKDE